MTKMKEVAALLGVEIGEEFMVTRADYDFRITDSRFEAITAFGKREALAIILYELLTGKREIIKKPWKPKEGEKYWYATFCGASPDEWQGGMMDLVYYAIGNCFRTEEEAEEHKKEVLARLKKIYDDGKPLIGGDE